MNSKTRLWIVRVVAIAAVVVACGAQAPSLFSRLTYQLSLRTGTKDAIEKPIIGTEIMHLVPHNGKLYAGASEWMEKDSQTPRVCQVLVLDSPHSSWKVAHQFTKQNPRLGALKPFTFTTDGAGKAIPPTSILLAAPDTIMGGMLQIFSLDDAKDEWVPMNFGKSAQYSSTRAIGLHHDRKTRIDHIFIGNNRQGVLSGVYDPAAPGRICWEKTAEFIVPLGERVMGFCDCNGVFYCATTNHIYMRGDGASPSWKPVYFEPKEIAPDGVRGLTAVPNPASSHSAQAGEVLAFVTLGKIRRVDPSANFQETVELDMHPFLTNVLGHDVRFVLAAYNEFLPYVIPGTKETVWLIGFECTFSAADLAKCPPPKPREFYIESKKMHFTAEARYVVRHASQGNIHYEVAEVTDPSLPVLVSVRAIAASPFAGEQGKALYFGGFDCNYQPTNSTGWIYRGQFPEKK